jgi:hypothetical protein
MIAPGAGPPRAERSPEPFETPSDHGRGVTTVHLEVTGYSGK